MSRRHRKILASLGATPVLLATICANAQAQSVLEIAAGIKFCRTVTDDAQRLKCFDSLFSEKKEAPQSDMPKPEVLWSLAENKSPIDDSPQVAASLADEDGAVLVLRCKEQKTEAAFGKQFAYLGSEPIKVLFRVNDGAPVQTLWHPSTNGNMTFAPSPVQFIQALPDQGKLFIRATGFGNKDIDGLFNLGNVGDVRNKIAVACKWPQSSTSSPPQAKQLKK